MRRRMTGRKPKLAVCASAAAAPMLAIVGTTAAQAAQPPQTPAQVPCCRGHYPIYTWQDGWDNKYLHVYNGDDLSRERINVDPHTGNDAQKWSAISLGVSPSGELQFAYQNVHSGLCLDDYNGVRPIGQSIGAAVVQFSCGNFNSRKRFYHSPREGTLINQANGEMICRARANDWVNFYSNGNHNPLGSRCSWH